MSENIYHITTRSAWVTAQAQGSYSPDSYRTEGFIHCSRLSQVLRVASTYYPGQKDLVLLQIDPGRLLSALRWEPGTDKPDELFPHIYGALNLEAVQDTCPLEADAFGIFQLPAQLS